MDTSRNVNGLVADDEEKRALRSENGLLRSQLEQIRADAIAALSRYGSSADAGVLRDAVERSSVLASPDKDDPSSSVKGPPSGSDAPMPLAEVERIHIQRVLAAANWHQGNTAAALGISSKTLYRKIREYGFVRPKNSAQPG